MVEVLLVVVILSILAAFAMVRFDQVREKSYDSVAVSDLRNAMTAIETYATEYFSYPSTLSDLALSGYEPSPEMEYTQFKQETKNGVETVHMHASHARSSYYYHANFPAEGVTLDRRSK